MKNLKTEVIDLEWRSCVLCICDLLAWTVEGNVEHSHDRGHVFTSQRLLIHIDTQEDQCHIDDIVLFKSSVKDIQFVKGILSSDRCGSEAYD